MDPLLYDSVLAISETGTLRDAQELLQTDGTTLNRNRRRIAQLKDALLDGGQIPKQRKPYRKPASRQGLRHLSGVPCEV